IGVAAVITMVTLGGGATQAVADQIRGLGSNLLNVRPGQQPRRAGGARPAARPFEAKDAEATRAEIPGITAVAPTAGRALLAIHAEANWLTNVTGTDNAYFKVRNWPLAAGREFTEAELRAGAMACILGASVRRKLFGAQDPLEAAIRLGPREETDFHVMDMQQIVAAVSSTTQTMTLLLGAVAAVSLLVGGIGIMNIMLVSGTEGTRAIGG